MRPQQRSRCRVRSQKARCRTHHLCVHNGVMDRHMVAAEAPAPRLVTGRITEDPHEVQPGIATPLTSPCRRPPLDRVQHILESHDRCHGHVSGLGQPGGHQPMGQTLLCGTHRRDRQTAVVRRRVEPSYAFVVIGHRPAGQRGLRLIERVDQRRGGVGHATRQFAARRVGHGPCSRSRNSRSGSVGSQVPERWDRSPTRRDRATSWRPSSN